MESKKTNQTKPKIHKTCRNREKKGGYQELGGGREVRCWSKVINF